MGSGSATQYKYLQAPLQLKADGPEGSVQALFSVFGTLDSDGDVVEPSFFTDGQEIPMAAWGHDWGALPPGKGVIRVTPEGAVFDGQFFTEATHGRDHYLTVKQLGGLQQWSFGFRVLESERGTKDGKPARFLRRGETFEASPVLVGANRNTRTLAIKGTRRPAAGKASYYGLEAPEGSYEDLAEDLAEAFTASGTCEAACEVTTVATFPNGVAYVCVCQPYSMDEPQYYQVQYDLGPDGDPVITGIQPVEASIAFAPSDEQQSGLSYAGQAERARAALSDLVVRTRSLADLRRKEGRTLSAANMTRMQTILAALRDAADELDSLLGAASPKPPAADASKAAALTETIRQAELALCERAIALTLTELGT